MFIYGVCLYTVLATPSYLLGTNLTVSFKRSPSDGLRFEVMLGLMTGLRGSLWQRQSCTASIDKSTQFHYNNPRAMTALQGCAWHRDWLEGQFDALLH